MTPFDHFIAIDWSARNRPSPAKPTKDAIWMAEASARGRTTVTYFRTRHACIEQLERKLLRLRGRRVLVGWDFALGYPKGFAKALRRKKETPWRAVWDHLSEVIQDGQDNRSNRFKAAAYINETIKAPCGPFWGVPIGQSGIFLGSKKDFNYPVPTKYGMLQERRLVEQCFPRMQPVWKLAYTGSVGSQSLLGIPYVRRLRDHEKLAATSFVWPFEEEWAGNAGAMILHAEIYPGLLTLPKRDKIPDREQVRQYVIWLQEQQRDGALDALLVAPWGGDRKRHKRVVRHEGWVIGVKPQIGPLS